jgi:membrane-bound ClpP family serine protease
MPSFGALGIGGLIAFIVGSIILFDTEGTGFEISLWLIGATAVTSAVIMMFGLGLAVRSFRRGVVSGAEEMLSATGKAMQDFEQEGRVFVHGEIWTAKSSQPLHAGQAVRVIGRDGLKARGRTPGVRTAGIRDPNKLKPTYKRESCDANGYFSTTNHTGFPVVGISCPARV